MSNLVPCKTCKKDVDKEAKTCPHCGASSPGVAAGEIAKGCLGIILFGIIFAFWFGTGSEEPKPTPTKPISEQKANNAPTINDENYNALVIEMHNAYLSSVESLIVHYNEFKNLEPHIFINWRNNEWSPINDTQGKKYNDIWEKNRLYISSQGGAQMFSAFSNLYLISVDVIRAIRENDKSYLKSMMERFKSDGGFFDSHVKSRNIKIEK